MANPGLATMMVGKLISVLGNKRVIHGPAPENVEYLTYLKGRIEAGRAV